MVGDLMSVVVGDSQVAFPRNAGWRQHRRRITMLGVRLLHEASVSHPLHRTMQHLRYGTPGRGPESPATSKAGLRLSPRWDTRLENARVAGVCYSSPNPPAAVTDSLTKAAHEGLLAVAKDPKYVVSVICLVWTSLCYLLVKLWGRDMIPWQMLSKDDQETLKRTTHIRKVLGAAAEQFRLAALLLHKKVQEDASSEEIDCRIKCLVESMGSYFYATSLKQEIEVGLTRAMKVKVCDEVMHVGMLLDAFYEVHVGYDDQNSFGKFWFRKTEALNRDCDAYKSYAEPVTKLLTKLCKAKKTSKLVAAAHHLEKLVKELNRNDLITYELDQIIPDESGMFEEIDRRSPAEKLLQQILRAVTNLLRFLVTASK